MAPAPEFPVEEAILSRDRKIKDIKDTIKSVVQSLCYRWTFDLKVPEQESPSSRENLSLEQQCVTMIIGICWKDKPVLLQVAEQFENEAFAKWRGWVNKPKAERGTVPEKTRHRPCPVSDEERQQLLDCLHQRLSAAWEPIKKQKTPKRFHSKDTHINDTPIRLSFGTSMERPSGQILYPALNNSSASSSESKRARDDSAHNNTPVKKAKASEILRPKSGNTMGPPPPDPFLNRDRPFAQGGGPKSADTSFASTVPSVFSQGPNSFLNSTQDTVPDDEPELPQRKSLPSAFTTRQPDKTASSSEFGTSSSFERRMADCDEEELIISNNTTADAPADEELSQDLGDIGLGDDEPVDPAEQQLRDYLASVFPKLPQKLWDAPLPVVYEITRVFLHADVPFLDFEPLVTDRLRDYDTLWKALKYIPALRDRPFPERCAEEVWKSSLDRFERGIHSVVLGGKLTFNDSLDSVFKLRLDPLKLDESHRLDRRWGSDRLLELIVPDLASSQVPATLKRLQKQLGADRCREIILEWLVDHTHLLFGRTWKSFFTRPTERRNKKPDANEKRIDAYRVNFFAMDGPGFLKTIDPLAAAKWDQPVMTTELLLDSIRPTYENENSTYLKLFSRTVLSLSRNQATLVLDEHQIIRQEDDIRHNGEVMNDGAGRISPSLAAKVKDMLALSYTPSAFQGRLGGAKGMWVIDYSKNNSEDWIEIYPSQQKWNRRDSCLPDDPSHRTLEVVGVSGPLKSADLNTQLLPLLMDRAPDKNAMKESLSAQLQNGLREKLDDIQAAMEAPHTFKKWIRESNANLKDKLKAGAITCLASLPISHEERLNVMLDAGFLPKENLFMKEQALKLFTFRCEELKARLNITVGKSCFPYMVPDFWGALEANEVYIDFSSFTDDVTGFQGVVLRDVDILVARSPAHFISDVQKVRAVVKPQFLGLKDVIVFPIKGNPSLAAKLSGGDYDGDRAWVCWEPSIVNNFVAAEVPDVPNLVDEGYLRKDARKYEEIVHGYRNPVSRFLKASFDFSMRPSMLGICTNFKENVCYKEKSVNTPAIVYLSQLLSDLVDQAKSGLTFDQDLWTKLKDEKIRDAKNRRIIPMKPAYSDGVVDACRSSGHILDHLTVVAHEAVDKAVLEFHTNFGVPPSWDDDLVIEYNWAAELAASNKAYADLLDSLKADLSKLQDTWGKFPWRTKTEDVKARITPLKEDLYERYRDIRPPGDNIIGTTMVGPNGNSLSQWELLKASTLFASYKRKNGKDVSNFVWWMAAKQLCHLKATFGGTGDPHSIIPRMYVLLRPDNNFIRRIPNSGFASSQLEERASVVNIEELEDRDDDWC